MKKVKFSVVIPTYNEANCIELTLKKIIEYFKSLNCDFEIIVSDDGSTDSTCEVVSKFINSHLEFDIKLLRNKHKGKGEAVKIGMLECKGDYSLFLDADFSVDIKEFDKFLYYVGNNEDVIIGSRRTKGAKILLHQPFVREFMGKVYTFLSNLILTTNYSDFTCGFKCFSKEATKKIFSKQKVSNWSFDSEILYLAQKLGFEVKEVGIEWRNSPNTKVRLLKDAVVSMLSLLYIGWRYNEKFRKTIFVILCSLFILVCLLYLKSKIKF